MSPQLRIGRSDKSFGRAEWSVSLKGTSWHGPRKAMAKTDARDSPRKEVRNALEDRGYALHLTSKRTGETITVKVELESLEEGKSLMKLVASGRIEDIDLLIGFDLEEEDLWNFMMRLMSLGDAMKGSVGVERDTTE